MRNIIIDLQERYQMMVTSFSVFLILLYLAFYPVMIAILEAYGVLITIPVIFLSLLGKRYALAAGTIGMIINMILEIFYLKLAFARILQWALPKVIVLFLALLIGSYSDLYTEKAKLLKEVEGNLEEIKQLRELLPICSYCKNIRNNKGYWEHVDEYLQSSNIATFTHGVCESCLENIQVLLEKED